MPHLLLGICRARVVVFTAVAGARVAADYRAYGAGIRLVDSALRSALTVFVLSDCKNHPAQVPTVESIVRDMWLKVGR